MDSREFLEISSDERQRAQRYEDLVNTYYDWATTTFPETWGGRLHFARLEEEDSFEESCIKQEEFLIDKLEIGQGSQCLDMGCGLGAPARYIVKKTGARVTGVDLSERRVSLANEEAQKENIEDLCDFQVGNVTSLAIADESFDAVYTIEVAAHVPNKEKFFCEAARLLKTGGIFAGWDWALLRVPTDEEYSQVVEPLLKYHGIANFLTADDTRRHLEDAGFDVEYFADETTSGTRPWWSESARRNIAAALMPSERRTPEVQILLETGRALVNAGKQGLLTPVQFWKAKKA